MDTVSYIVVPNFEGVNQIYIIFTHPDGSQTSMLKADYDAQREASGATLTQAELDAEAVLVAKAQADATAQAEAEATAQATFEANLAATNAKLEKLGLTAQDISVLLNAAKA